MPCACYCRIRDKDPYDTRSVVVYVASLLSLNKSNELFQVAHKLIGAYEVPPCQPFVPCALSRIHCSCWKCIHMSPCVLPLVWLFGLDADEKSVVGWYAVGCYYLSIRKLDLARQYFGHVLHSISSSLTQLHRRLAHLHRRLAQLLLAKLFPRSTLPSRDSSFVLAQRFPCVPERVCCLLTLCLRKATTLDPRFAHAWIGMGNASAMEVWRAGAVFCHRACLLLRGVQKAHSSICAVSVNFPERVCHVTVKLSLPFFSSCGPLLYACVG